VLGSRRCWFARSLVFVCLAAAPVAFGNEPVAAGNITQERLLNHEREPQSWLTGGRDWRQTYYSPLQDVNADNVGELGFAWHYDVDFSSTLEATPIVVDSVMYTSGNRGSVYALDAATGILRWKFEPSVATSLDSKVGYGEINRGVAVAQGKVYVGAVDGWLYALSTASGTVVWKVDTIVDRNRAYSSTGAPYIAGNRVIIGNAGAEYDARGYVSAYDIETGKRAWRFFTVPGDPKKRFEHPELEKAARTWSHSSRWEVGLGGTAWDGMAYDPELNLLYVGTGNGTPWDRNLRSPGGGDNLFLASILALNPDTGRLVWHYQTVPGDTWDYTATQKMILADLTIQGRTRRTILQAPKNGFFYVLDRATGELLSAQPYTKVNWASRVDLKTGRPQETGLADFSRAPRLVQPGPNGAHQWQPMSYNPVTGLVYIPVQDIPAVFAPLGETFEYKKGQANQGLNRTVIPPSGKLPAGALPAGVKLDQSIPRPKMFLRAWNPVEQRSAWEVEMTGAVDDSSSLRRPGGVMSTASALVFQGHIDGHFRVFDGRTGAQLRDINVGTSMMAAPMTYRIGGEQYVSIMAGVGAFDGYADKDYGNKGRIVTFKLGGGDVPLRALVSHDAAASSDSALPPAGTLEQIASGRVLYERHCAMCHAAGRAPDLTRMTTTTHAEFPEILQKGTRAARGMPSFRDALTPAEVQAIHAFVIDTAAKARRPPATQLQPQTSAQKMIASCEAFAAQKKLTPLSIAVVDESGALLAFARQQGASAVTGEVAVMKAQSAAKIGAPTSVLAHDATEDPAARDLYALLKVVTMPGAWPFSDSSGTVRGAVGVSGALAKDDSDCAQWAVESSR
jgi:quinohemoprotein ethanol dehydrogenase